MFWPHLWKPLNCCVQFFLVFAVFCLVWVCDFSELCCVRLTHLPVLFITFKKFSLSLSLRQSLTHALLFVVLSLSVHQHGKNISALNYDSSSNEHRGLTSLLFDALELRLPWKQQRHVYVFTATDDSYYSRLHNSWCLFLNIVHTIWISWIIIQYKLWNNES